jgi:uncharacterized tellurite resistance protein B-like protein
MAHNSQLLLKTAFCCMACDGDIDEREINLIKKLAEGEQVFNVDDLEETLNQFIQAINQEGERFLKRYFEELKQTELTESEEIQLVKTALRTIEADKEIAYSEIKFFKIIRSNLKVSDQQILDELPGKEDYLEKDIMAEDYESKLQSEYFKVQELPEFQSISIE